MEMRRGIDNKVVSRQFIDYFKSCLSISVNRKRITSVAGILNNFSMNCGIFVTVTILKRTQKSLL